MCATKDSAAPPRKTTKIRALTGFMCVSCEVLEIRGEGMEISEGGAALDRDATFLLLLRNHDRSRSHRMKAMKIKGQRWLEKIEGRLFIARCPKGSAAPGPVRQR